MVTLANLSKIKPDIWKEIPEDVQQAIMKLSLEENKSQPKDRKPEDKQKQYDTSGVTIPRQYSRLKANMSQTSSPSLDIVD